MFQVIEGGNIPQSIVKQVKVLIREGHLAYGDQLLGERQLMRELNVSRSSLREALQVLEATGFVRIVPGKGTFVQPPTTPSELLVETIMWPWSDPGEEALAELFEVRRLLEVEAAGLATERAMSEALEQIRSRLDHFVSVVESREIRGMAHSDVEFHRAIFLATGNKLLLTLIDSIESPLRELREFAFRVSGGRPETIENHTRVLARLCTFRLRNIRYQQDEKRMNAAI